MLPVLSFALGMSLPSSTQTCRAESLQNAPSANRALHGQVVDQTGAPIPNAQVLLKSTSGERLYKTADKDGCYLFTAPPALYTVAARSEGFRVGSTNVRLMPAGSSFQNVVLELGGCTECVNIQGVEEFNPCIADMSGTPIATAQVTLIQANTDGVERVRAIKLDDWGCGWTQLAGKHYFLTVIAQGFRSVRIPLSVRLGQPILSTSKVTLRRD